MGFRPGVKTVGEVKGWATVDFAQLVVASFPNLGLGCTVRGEPAASEGHVGAPPAVYALVDGALALSAFLGHRIIIPRSWGERHDELCGVARTQHLRRSPRV